MANTGPAQAARSSSGDRAALPSAPEEPVPPGLVHAHDAEPGITRRRRGKHYTYTDSKGRRVTDPSELDRIRRLAIPPAYTDVWICPRSNGHLQATGRDARGRKQYRYHPDWRLWREGTKFDRLEAFGLALPAIRRRVARDLAAQGDGGVQKKAVLAALVRLLDTSCMRVGNDEYARTNGSYGLTTLERRHVAVRGQALRLRFKGKSGVLHEVTVDDPRVARVVQRCQRLPGQSLFQYTDVDGTPHQLDSADVNDYLRSISGDDFTAKLFRTWHGTSHALMLIFGGKPPAPETTGERVAVQQVLEAVARRLGNTPAVCRKSYIHPDVLALLGRAGAESSGWTCKPPSTVRGLTEDERLLLAFLQERRRAEKTASSTARSSKAAQTPKPKPASTRQPGKRAVAALADDHPGPPAIAPRRRGRRP